MKYVLIADDDAMLVEALRIRCDHLGLKVRTATDGMTVLALIHDEVPDLVFLDIQMPAVDGLEVCRKLARGHAVVPIPVIMLTGRADEPTRRRCTELGAYYVLKAPDAWKRLKPIVCQLLGLHPAAWDRVRRTTCQPPAELSSGR
jgi:DNA-binding response OmpR family regulator